VNRFTVSGNITQAPTLVAVKESHVLEFHIAENDRIHDSKTKTWVEITNYFDVKVWGPRAEALFKILRKGSHVTIYGKIRQARWQDQTGEMRTKYAIIADSVDLPPKPKETPKDAA
jgi:single-strand DNA-binding protein